ncbi:hypothetical protein COO60DRAFT_1550442 [Scenedesmus sp. NREL 46B-D3]|nr:hypothetical protein COO60DRAFT_1550442 [Scenedesmus sp. NREL 46B-D3]
MSVLMHFGPPYIHRQPDLGWAPYHQHLAGKTRSQLAAYLLVLLEHLADCAADPDSSHGSADFLPHTLLFMGPRGVLPPSKIWERITALHLLAMKMWQHGSRPPAAFVVGGVDRGGPSQAGTGRRGGAPLYRSLSGRPGGWGHSQDFGLVRGIFLAGYECWPKILGLQSLQLKQALRTELGLPLDYDSAQRADQAATPPPGTPPAEAHAVVQAQITTYNRKILANRKKEVEYLDKRAKQIVTALRQEYASGAGGGGAAAAAQPRQQLAVMPQQQQPPQQQRAPGIVGGPGAAPSRMQQAAAQA